MTLDDDRDGLECNPQPAGRSVDLPQRPKKAKKQPPQRTIEEFWDKFTTKHKGKIWTVLPSNGYARTKAANMPEGVIKGHRAIRSYEKAKAECIAAVEKIASECQRVNQKYRDPHFDIEFDLKMGRRYCLNGLIRADREMQPKSVKRVTVSCGRSYTLERSRLNPARISSMTRNSTSRGLRLPMSDKVEMGIVGLWRRYVRLGTRRI